MNTADSTTSARRDTPDAVGRGSFGPAGGAPSTLFVLAGSSLGATLIEGEGTPQWFDLRAVVALDAIGEAEGSRVQVEMAFDDGGAFQATWPEAFCDKVVARLRELLEAGAMAPRAGEPAAAPGAPSSAAPSMSGSGLPPAPSASPFGGAPAAVGEVPGGDVAGPAPVGAVPPTAGRAVGGDLPLPGDGPPLASTATESGERELVLHDVVYHGGYPGQAKRRKKCSLVLGREGAVVSGPGGDDIVLSWGLVRSVEAQNTDEAKFRLNLRTKRGSTTLVIECAEDVTVLVEAREVPTLPLRAAIAEMVAGRDVVVA